MKRCIILAFALLLAFSALAETITTGTVYVRDGGGTLNLRAGADTATQSLGFVKHGDEVVVHSSEGSWSRVTVTRTGQTGYIKTGYIRNLKTTSPEEVQLPATDIDFRLAESCTYALPGEFTIDLDQDGVVETLRAQPRTREDGSEYTSISVWTAGGANDSKELDIAWGASAWFARMGADKRVYVFVSGDVLSDDYVTYCLYWDGAAIRGLPFVCPAPYAEMDGEYAPGAVTGVFGDNVVIATHREALGTWWASYPYALAGGAITAKPNDLWRIINDLSDAETWNSRKLVTTMALPATVYGADIMLDIGTILLPTAIDEAASRYYFITGAGDAGYFSVTKNEENWGAYIGGTHEEQCFQALMYAG